MTSPRGLNGRWRDRLRGAKHLAMGSGLSRRPMVERHNVRLKPDPRPLCGSVHDERHGCFRGDRATATDDLGAFLDEARIVLAAVDAAQGRIALEARIRFGRGMGREGDDDGSQHPLPALRADLPRLAGEVYNACIVPGTKPLPIT